MDRQLTEIRKTIHEQNKKYNRETEFIKKKKIEILELKNIMNEMKKCNREHQQRLITQKQESMILKMGHLKPSSQNRKEKRMKKNKSSLCELWNTIKQNNIQIMGVLEGEEREEEKAI